MTPKRPRARLDGLVGLTQAERDLVQQRIDLVSAAKFRAGGRDLLPIEIAIALHAPSAGAREHICPTCFSRLPWTAEFFRPKGKGCLSSRCRTCKCRDGAAYEHTWAAKRSRRRNIDRRREAAREYMRRVRAERKAAGIRLERNARERLLNSRQAARVRLRRATDPEKIERIRCHIENLTHEIERMTEEEDR